MDASARWQSGIGSAASRLGTRFLVFPQPPFIQGYERPEMIWVSTPPDAIGPGPADRRMYVIDPLLEKQPYQFPYLPPYAGALRPPAVAGPDGHFDNIPLGTPEFEAAHAYACVRRVLDICESYVGREIPWFFEPTYPRLEIVPRLNWDNAQSGYGFLEMGIDEARGTTQPFALNFDAVAHEIGHLVIFGVMGVPRFDPPHEYFAYHEAVADFIALISLLHFDTALDLLLRRTRGNLLINNELDRFGELSDEKQVRRFSHSLRMSDVSTEVHDLSKPFAGALFDILIEIYQVLLFERGLSDLDPRDFRDLRSELSEEEIEDLLSASLAADGGRLFALKSALEEARDLVGEILVRSWELLDPHTLDYREAAEAMIVAAESGRASRFVDSLVDNFAWREIF
ncbi:MAG: hypothetical protein E5Y79_29555 [Mesorhizobium sp.]|uniref:hypothetical protein n=1 Tax=Mesorhizobium sp. TaxID=1871066 RepID=UPI00121C1385|nr:hypothetical protein [Mesorhizobium sp.]TIL39997.1 MAG: hypothetical protein E5Y86_33115 [Mesorhizobium sp.]TIL56500.1 MAG: hypothetical protein E5Y79_29555 [Mesorhizobium sp.]